MMTGIGWRDLLRWSLLILVFLLTLTLLRRHGWLAHCVGGYG